MPTPTAAEDLAELLKQAQELAERLEEAKRQSVTLDAASDAAVERANKAQRLLEAVH